jgi:hypothetical protein
MVKRALLLCSIFSTFALSGCTEPPEEIQAPLTWQAHLQEANLPPNFVPAITESIYVPVYSHIYHEDAEKATLLVSTLSIRNTDSLKSLIIKSIRYYDTQGQLIQSLLNKPVVLGPFGTAEVVVPRTHEKGGSGANFVVDWMSADKVHEPIVEAVMVSTGAAQSVSFTSRGVVIDREESGASPKAEKPQAQPTETRTDR